MNRILIVPVLALVLATASARRADACGPATHAREAGKVFDAVSQSYPEWAAIADVPNARAWIQFGAMAPDFQNATSLLKFGHSSGLSLYLLEQAQEAGPEYMWFALGHLAHNASDNSCESFYTAAFFGSAPLGMFDFTEDDRGALGESEGMVEAFGDAITGDWDALVDVFFDFWLDGEEARQRGEDAFMWYCENGATYHNKNTDCAKAFVDFSTKLDSVDKFLGGFGRELAKEIVHKLIDLPLPDLADLFMSGTLQAILGDLADMPPTPWAQKELVRMKQSALMDPSFWDVYFDHFGLLGPTWTLDRLEGASTKWPTFDGYSQICGNVQSMMQFLPDEYDVTPGLIVDDVQWLDAEGKKVKEVSGDMSGDTLTAHFRFFAAFSFEGKVIGTVRRDGPGFDQLADDVLGEAAIDVSLDPFGAAWEPRIELDVPFVADTANALGFYLDVTVEGSSGPTFTTSWDRIWTIGDLDLDRPVYVDNFGTYGHWPPSLPVAEPAVEPSVLFVKARVPPAGDGVPGAEVEVLETSSKYIAGNNGQAVFDNLPSGNWTVDATADGYVSAGAVKAATDPLGVTWADLFLHPVPDVSGPEGYWSNATCMPFDWDVSTFDGQAAGFTAWMETEGSAATAWEIEVGTSGEAIACSKAPAADGDRVRVGVRATYTDGSSGVDGFGPFVSIDGSPPVISRAEAAFQVEPPCVSDPASIPVVPPLEVTLDFAEPHSALSSVNWRIGERGWQEADWSLVEGVGGAGTVSFTLAPDQTAAGQSLTVRLTNGAGLSAETGPMSVPFQDESDLCVIPPPDQGPDAFVQPDAAPDVGGDPGGFGEGGGGGCSSAAAPAGPAASFILIALLLCPVAVRRSSSFPSSH